MVPEKRSFPITTIALLQVIQAYSSLFCLRENFQVHEFFLSFGIKRLALSFNWCKPTPDRWDEALMMMMVILVGLTKCFIFSLFSLFYIVHDHNIDALPDLF